MAIPPFEDVVVEHGPTVLRVCRALLGDGDADDAWSETFLAAMRAYPDLPDDSNVEAWLVTIAKHKVIDAHRQRGRRPVPVELVPDSGQRGTGWQGGDEHLDRDDGLWAAVAALPRMQREAVAYHHVAGLPYAEVAKLLGNSEAAARRAAADGVKRLRRTYRRVP